MRLRDVVLLALMVASLATAQVQRGSISGTVFDPQGAVVPNAQITATDNSTGATITVKSGSEGTFTIPGLSFGTYSVKIVAPGFRQWEAAGVQVITAQDSNLRATLAVGGTNEVVTVEDVQAPVDAASSELKTHVDRQQIVDLPSTTRNPLDFATQLAGVTSTGSSTSGASIMNGLRGSSNNLVQDGIDVRDSFIKTAGFSAASSIALESIGEFSITGQNVGADSGDGVVQIRMTTARGGNQFHGSAFYAGRNDAFNANSWNNNFTGTPRPILRQHRYGGSIGGPVEIPKVYHGKDRTFFFFSYSVFQRHFQSTDSRTVLTAPARTGLFTYQGADGQSHTVNLLTASSRNLPINSFTKSLIDAIPLPVAGGSVSVNPTAGDGLNIVGIRFNTPGAELDKLYDLRVDHKIFESAKWGTHWLEGDWHWEHDPTTPGADAQFPKGIATNCVGAVCDVQDNTDFRQRLAALAINSSFGASAFNEVRFGFSRPEITFLPPPFGRTFNVYFPGVTNQAPNPANAISNPEYAFDPQGRLSPFYSLADNFTKVKGAHTIKAGLLISSASTHRFNDFAGGSGVNGGVIPVVALGSNATNSDGLSSCSGFPSLPTGSAGSSICTRAQSVFSAVTGLVNNISQTYNAIPGQGYVSGLTDAFFIRERSYNFYGQDSWKARPNLTVNAGLRWEVVPAADMVNKRMLIPSNELGDVTPYGPLFHTSSSVTYNDLLGSLASTTQLVPGGESNGKPFWRTRYNNLAPSIGVAWQPSSKTVLRGGYSISFVRDTLTIISNVTTSNLGLHSGVAVSPTAGDPLAVLNSSVNQVLPPPAFAVPQSQYKNFLASFSSAGGSGIYAIDPNLRTPYVQQWSFGVQRELSPVMAMEVRYVGNHATGMYRGDDLSQPNVTPGLLSEFQQAATNLTICTANRLACTGSNTGTPTFANKGLAGQGPLPILEKINFPTSFYSNSTFTNTFNPGQQVPGQFWFLVSNNCTQQLLKATGCQGLGTLPANFFLPNPFTAFDQAFTNGMSSSYNAMQVELRRRLSHGLQFQANYTWAKVLSNSGITGSQSELDRTLDFHQPGYNRTRADFDIHHTLHFNGVYEFPFGRGRRWLSTGFVGKALEGWQAGGLWTSRSGIPMTLVSGLGTVNRTGNSGNNPAVALGMNDAAVCSAVGVYKDPAKGASYLPSSFVSYNNSATAAPGATLGANSAVLTNPSPGLLGDHGLFKSCSGPNLHQVDVNFVKKTKITERIIFELRAEMFNIFNHPNFSVSATPNINSAGFGVLSNTFTSREIQFNGRISF
ncbi:MAG TPA: TonB-dependent receptor [Bryobacteraceae bacterium]|nr:TonB-dependent receptor [Bryobacteraceae bacterium]